MKNFKKRDLKTGMKIVTRDGEKSIYIDNPSPYGSYFDIPGGIFVGSDGVGFSYIDDYDENLNQVDDDPDYSDLDIMEVYIPTPNTALKAFTGKYNDTEWELVWNREESKANIKYIEGDILSCPRKSAIVHCISADCNFGAMAKYINTHLDIKKNVQKFIQNADFEELGGFVVPTGSVYSIIMSKYSYETPDIKNLKIGMNTLYLFCIENGVSMISIPKNDDMFKYFDWNTIEEIISDAFKNSDVEINIYM